MRLNEIHRQFKDRVRFYCVYIQEAHAIEHWQVLGNIWEDIAVAQPDTADQRAEVAATCALRLGLEMPMLLDDMDNQVDLKYAAMPERLFVIDAAGIVAYRSEMGPFGFTPEDWRDAIAAQVSPS